MGVSFPRFTWGCLELGSAFLFCVGGEGLRGGVCLCALGGDGAYSLWSSVSPGSQEQVWSMSLCVGAQHIIFLSLQESLSLLTGALRTFGLQPPALWLLGGRADPGACPHTSGQLLLR